MSRFILNGQSASRGLGLGRARLVGPVRLESEEQRIDAADVADEIKRLGHAIAAARAELNELRERLQGALSREIGDFLDTHALLLDDPELLAGLDDLIHTGRYTAMWALRLQRDRLVAVFDAMDDPYLKSRREDIDHVIGRVAAALRRGSGDQPGVIKARSGEVLVAESVPPAELAHMHERGIVAVITSLGSPLSHSAILARSLRLPMVVGSHEALERIDEGDMVLVDGESGEIIIHPDAEDLRSHRAHQDEIARDERRRLRLRHVPSRTQDGVSVKLYANAESTADVSQAYAFGASGVGLYRTEFLFLQRDGLPDEDEQFFAYRDIVLGMAGRPVTIRTLDLGADKADASGLTLPNEPNPALGMRGIRLSLKYPEVFRTQLRAILRAGAYGPIRVLVPMICHGGELARVRQLLQESAQKLDAAGLAHAENVALGAMIEVPAAALAMKGLLAESDFIAVGSNDLVQYLLAADRANDAVGHLYDPLHPAVVALLARIFDAADRAGKAVTLCGEIAGDPRYTRLLLALGLRRFSMHPTSLLEVKEVIRECDSGELAALRRRLLRARDSAAMRALL
jgi:phosphoenolpyruvate-protein phosphotransferase (PTS system enzyme I)